MKRSEAECEKDQRGFSDDEGVCDRKSLRFAIATFLVLSDQKNIRRPWRPPKGKSKSIPEFTAKGVLILRN